VISTSDFELNASFTPDGKTVYFSKSDPGFNRITIVLSHRKGNDWTKPEVAPFSGIWEDMDPRVSPDGKKLFSHQIDRSMAATRPRETTTFGTSTVFLLKDGASLST
jgi:hypothetical protein